MRNTIDKNMLEFLHQSQKSVVYINSRDRELTDNTLERFIYEKERENIFGDCYNDMFSAVSFVQRNYDYYRYIAKSCIGDLSGDETLDELFEKIYHSVGWVTLIIRNIDLVADKKEQLDEMIQYLYRFAGRKAHIIISGSGSIEEVFGNTDAALDTVSFSAFEADDECVRTVIYEQEEKPETEEIIYAEPMEENEELIYNWEMMNYYLSEYNCFDFSYFKRLYFQTWQYFGSRIKEEYCYRKDILLIREMSYFKRSDGQEIYGCKNWEYDAAYQLTKGLTYGIAGEYHNVLDEKSLLINVMIYDQEYNGSGIHITGYMERPIRLTRRHYEMAIDALTEEIHRITYDGE
ncbi:hypothetical protein SAMN02910353_02534 [Ruminococcus sp. YRD2003]|uniref:hypothetical protein n=1 Tax=Ruminococcus sp. YRD2003 TaxID=1452313 RepID=UPI0008BC8474|nr:hypothetical protein SAMN02910353_02534 [Ruminococcus flavefaciens]